MHWSDGPTCVYGLIAEALGRPELAKRDCRCPPCRSHATLQAPLRSAYRLNVLVGPLLTFLDGPFAQGEQIQHSTAVLTRLERSSKLDDVFSRNKQRG